MKQQILKLHSEGKTYNEIRKILKCSKSTISYYCNPTTKLKSQKNRNKNRQLVTKELKQLHGGKCSICNYNKSLNALHFHHIDPKTKEGHVGNLVHVKGKYVAFEEAKKCQLICANCHSEIHDITLN